MPVQWPYCVATETGKEWNDRSKIYDWNCWWLIKRRLLCWSGSACYLGLPPHSKGLCERPDTRRRRQRSGPCCTRDIFASDTSSSFFSLFASSYFRLSYHIWYGDVRAEGHKKNSWHETCHAMLCHTGRLGRTANAYVRKEERTCIAYVMFPALFSWSSLLL